MRSGNCSSLSCPSKSPTHPDPGAPGDWSSSRELLYPAADPTVEAIRKCRTLGRRSTEADEVGDFQIPRVSMIVLSASASRETFLNSS